jgi:hypothetical protein
MVFESNNANRLHPGAPVEVRTRFDGRWSRGFEIAAIERDLVLLRRRSDGAVLPRSFQPADVRPAG